jgi:hypothetical protein
MLTHHSRQPAHPLATARNATARLRRITAVLAAITCGVLASAAIVSAASATILVPDPGGAAGTIPLAPVRAPAIHAVTGGMAGWQITLIALGAALVAAIAAVLLDRALAARRAATAA